MPETIEYTDPEEYRAAVKATQQGKKRTAKGRPKSAKLDLPRPSTSQPQAGESSVGDMHDALMRLAKRGLMPRYRAGVGHDCWAVDGRSTPVCDDYHEAVRAAERTKD